MEGYASHNLNILKLIQLTIDMQLNDLGFGTPSLPVGQPPFFSAAGMQVREYLDEKSNFAARLQQALDLEGLDRDTVHRLVSLLLKFMAACDLKTISEDRQATKAQSVVIRHLGLLLGYMQQEKSFTVPPSSIRYEPFGPRVLKFFKSVLFLQELHCFPRLYL